MGEGIDDIRTGCVIAGGGPAGMMLGLLLARKGVEVIVLEKHADFLRDFRGDTIHPSTLEVMKQLGLLEDFLKRPHQKVARLSAFFGETEVPFADFSHLKVACPYVAMMPQWEFLDFLADAGRRHPSFRVMMQAKAESVVEERGRVVGIHATTADGPVFIRADLVVAADGRHSTLRAAAGLVPRELGAPIDALWLRLPRLPSDPDDTFGRFSKGRMLVMINRQDYWQCAYLIPKGGYAAVKTAGIEAFRAALAEVAPFVADRTKVITDWKDVSLLTITVNRLETWHRPGFLAIGDAAHAMSPVGGVGVNLAVQDAVASANILAEPLLSGFVGNGDLAALQRRRLFPTRVTQRLQVLAQKALFGKVFAPDAETSVPPPLRLFRRFPVLRRIPARIVGIGVRPEHVR
ncbi:FAD-dependent oxidoreductase [Methylobrevis pamukkalensis]|uniref:2-octaprenyl-3-methyl-6-methoxy-1,4-benzoquinol hydroxylase n=1 Tax=Methylobrevis pamukkalensis TaxID=1439726 RepID=A0A1E3H0P7_9HYPH|nr:FAD-dependent oxidoreductase [Methylobrevis pamukkalensis]ODN69903.1 2-octaprenyl-3-methyl-6-methoxy-1,4-benzoquinol hydroxylase [Methylobrevis pamukkalensis]